MRIIRRLRRLDEDRIIYRGNVGEKREENGSDSSRSRMDRENDGFNVGLMMFGCKL